MVCDRKKLTRLYDLTVSNPMRLNVVSPCCTPFSIGRFLMAELARREIDNVGLGEEGNDFLDIGKMGRVLLDVELAVLDRGEFHDKGVRDTVLVACQFANF